MPTHTRRQPLEYRDKTTLLTDRTRGYYKELQDRICTALEEVDGSATFRSDEWSHASGGGGLSRVIEGGDVFEKGGVNFSAVSGMLPDRMATAFGIEPAPFFATGISLVIHPRSPLIPTVHANFRYFEMEGGDSWFGGGADLTPFTPDAEAATHFHATLQEACNPYGKDLYPRFKKECDEYFWIAHRNEARGVGGLFFDYLRGDAKQMEDWFTFQRSVGDAFLPSYLPIVSRRIDEEWSDRQLQFQRLRRGRYAEFNLVIDRGTKFGLETGGRTESILMSLPPVAEWHYQADFESDEQEEKLMSWLREPRQWT